MHASIDDIVARLAALPVAQASLQHAGAIVASLGGHQRQLAENKWSVIFDAGPFAAILVEIETYAGERTMRLTLTPRTPDGLLTTITADAAAWTRSVALPDSGTVKLLRRWRDLPSQLSVGCSIARGSGEGHTTGDLVCFVDEP